MYDKFKVNARKEVFVRDAKKNLTFLPEEFHPYVPEVCSCGAPVVISKTRKTVRCIDTKCRIKGAYRMADMFSRFSIKGYGDSFCYGLLVENPHWDSYLDVWGIVAEEFKRGTSPSVIDDLLGQIAKVQAKPITFKEFVSRLALPSIKGKANDIFTGVDSFQHLHNRFKTVQEFKDFFMEGLGTYTDFSEEMFDTVMDFWSEIGLASMEFNIIPDVSKQYKIAITGDIWREKDISRDSFSAYVNEISGGKTGVHICKAFASIDYVIADTVSNSRTYNIGESRGLLITSKEFCDMIRRGLS